MRSIVIRNEGVRQLVMAALQLVAMTAIYLFLSRVYVPATGIIGTAKVIDAHAEGPAKPRL